MQKGLSLFIVFSLVSIFMISFAFAEDNSTVSNSTQCAEKTYLECGTSQGNSASITVKILGNCDKASTVNELCAHGCDNGVCIAPSIFKQQVKCVFNNSNEIQSCSSDGGKFGCSGIGHCVADVSGEKGKTLTWKSSCGGYAYTIIDGENKYAEFNCPTSNTDQDLCLKDFNNYYDQETNKCYPGFSKDLISKSCSDPDGGINKYLQAHTYGFRSVFADSQDQRIRTGGKDSCLSSNELVEYYCDPAGYIQPSYINCPNGCSNGVCIKGEEVKEQVLCVFENSKEEQKCYSSEDNTQFSCSGAGDCITGVSGYKGDKLVWKSTCGGYGATILDGDDETVKFDCGSGETNSTEIKDNGFKKAYWQCYNGKEWKSEGENCLSSELWQKKAANFCVGLCKGEKCGVNSFSVGDNCYSDEDKDKILCTEDAKLCPDGSVVGRDPLNNCEFFSCEAKTNTTISLICKDSCPLNEKCYPFGYRKTGKFCSDSNSFEPQLKGSATCDNNFECSSNLCISNQCVSQGAWNKFTSWFKRLFGKD